MKSTQAEVQQRVEAVLKMRLLGAEFHDIREYANVSGPSETPPRPSWNVSDSQIRRYIAASDKLLEKSLEKDRSKLLNRHIAQRRALFARCMAASDYTNAKGILKDEAELLGLYPPKTIRVSDVSDDDIEAAVAAELAKLDGSGSGPLPEPAAPGDRAAGTVARSSAGDGGGGIGCGPLAGGAAPLFGE